MSSSKLADTGASSGPATWPIATIVTIVFLILKLTGVIDWSWWWVLSPLWISALFTAFILLLIFLGFVLYYALKND
jgi:hypothetical protein